MCAADWRTARTKTSPTQRVRPAEDNVRHGLGDVTNLIASIPSAGVMEPLLVCPAEVPCVVKVLSDLELLRTMTAENLVGTGPRG